MKRLVLFLAAVMMAAGLGCGCSHLHRGASVDEPALRIGGSEAFPVEAPAVAAAPAPAVVDGAASPAPAPAAVADPAAVAAVAPGAAPGASPAASVADGVAYKIRAGDSLIITIRTLQSEQMELLVDEKGEIRLPFIGAIPVSGLTIGELESSIAKQYVDKKIYKVVTAHVFVPMRSFFVRGEVRAPGRYPIMGSVTLLQAIATASGYTDFADPRDVRIKRGDKMIRANAREAEKNTEKDLPIEAGDVISVERSWY